MSAYAAVIRSRIRAQRSYPVSFRLDLLSSLLVGFFEFAEVWVIFSNVGILGGLTFHQILLVFGLANVAFATADLITGQMDRIPAMLRAGTFEIYYLRPQPLLAQMLTSDFQLRRLSRTAVGLITLVLGLTLNDVGFSIRTVVLLLISVVGGVAIFAALFVTAGGVQFFVINGAELTNSFTYGGAYAAAQPGSIFPNPLKIFFGFAFPVLFTGYLPTLGLLHLPVPSGFPAAAVWGSPIAAVWAWAVALFVWRAGVRHYRGAGG